jgi:hypothetical protein
LLRQNSAVWLATDPAEQQVVEAQMKVASARAN